MHYALLLHSREPAPGEIEPEAITEMQHAFQAYLAALDAAGVLRAAEILTSQAMSTTLTRRTGELQVQDGPFAETKEALAGVFVVEVADLDAAIGWAEKCPAASYGTLEIRPVATWGDGPEWKTPDPAPAQP